MFWEYIGITSDGEFVYRNADGDASERVDIMRNDMAEMDQVFVYGNGQPLIVHERYINGSETMTESRKITAIEHSEINQFRTNQKV